MYEDKELVFFINITKACNLYCKHCYLTEKNRYVNKHNFNIEYVESFLKNDFFKDKKITIIWQGGEVTIIDPIVLEKYIIKLNKLNKNLKHTMVTNLKNKMSIEYIELINKYMVSKIETTLALDDKFLSKQNQNENDYLKKFINNHQYLNENNITVPINLELNRGSFEKKPIYLIKFLEEISKNQKNKVTLDLDYSFNFFDFNKNKVFNKNNYPMVETQLKYSEISSYLYNLYILYSNKKNNYNFKINFLDEIINEKEITPFNVQSDYKFFTFNPDGTITTNPLYSDLKETFLGNININTIDEMINSENRISKIKFEENRVEECKKCEFYNNCKGSISNAPIFQNNDEECIGFYYLRKKILKLQKK